MNDPRDIRLILLVLGDVDGQISRFDDVPGSRTIRNTALHEGQINPLGSGVVDIRHPDITPALTKQIPTSRSAYIDADHRCNKCTKG